MAVGDSVGETVGDAVAVGNEVAISVGAVVAMPIGGGAMGVTGLTGEKAIGVAVGVSVGRLVALGIVVGVEATGALGLAVQVAVGVWMGTGVPVAVGVHVGIDQLVGVADGKVSKPTKGVGVGVSMKIVCTGVAWMAAIAVVVMIVSGKESTWVTIPGAMPMVVVRTGESGAICSTA